MAFLLEILIPTYNRSGFLEKNLKILEKFILNNDFLNKVGIILSNNASTDDTNSIVADFEKKKNISSHCFEQSKNIGLEKNALFVLEKAKAEYVMYCGDDDYIQEKYLIGVINALENDKDITCILPSFQHIDMEGKLIKNSGRDLSKRSKIFSKGFRSFHRNSWRAHQLSGVVFKREGTLEEYKMRSVCNLYPFIFFVAFNCFRGKTYHYTNYPVHVTVPPSQKYKDWDYGNDGLITDIFDNYKKLGLNFIILFAIEIKLLVTMKSRYLSGLLVGKYKNTLKAIGIIVKHPNTIFLTKIFFIILLPVIILLYLRKHYKR